MANAVEDVFRMVAQLVDTATNSRFQNVYYAQAVVLNDPSDTAINADAVEIMNGIYNTIAPQMNVSMTGENIRVTNVTKRERVGQPDWFFAGSGAGLEQLPPQVAAQILFPLKAVGRTGRKYLPPFTEASQANGEWVAAAKTALGNCGQAIANLWNGLASTNEYQLGIARFNGPALLDFTEFVDGVWEVTDFARTQRRRTSGIGLT